MYCWYCLLITYCVGTHAESSDDDDDDGSLSISRSDMGISLPSAVVELGVSLSSAKPSNGKSSSSFAQTTADAVNACVEKKKERERDKEKKNVKHYNIFYVFIVMGLSHFGIFYTFIRFYRPRDSRVMPNW